MRDSEAPCAEGAFGFLLTFYANGRAQAAQPAACARCKQRGVVQSLHLLDVPSRSVSTVSLCARHRIPEHLSQSVVDTREFEYVTSRSNARDRLLRRRRPPSSS